MPQKTALVQTRVPPEIRAKLEAVAGEAGLTVSGLLRLLIDNVVSEEEAPAPKSLPSKSRREGKVTARLPRGVREKLEEEAKERGVTVSTWVGSMLQARYRRAARPLPPDRRQFMRVFRKISGVAVNANQMARAMNKAVLTSSEIDVTAAELRRLSDELRELRRDARNIASGAYKFQVLSVECEDE
nr:MobC family plasmid mobilization relaxosome protein [uncultured Celeribacter sp.]